MANKEMIYRNDGMAYALKVAKEGGIEALEKEVAFRKATMLPTEIRGKGMKAVEEFVEGTKRNCLDTVLIMSLMVLRDEFDFGEKRLNRFKARFNDKSGDIADGLVNWEEIQEALMDETGVKTVIRNKDFLDDADK